MPVICWKTKKTQTTTRARFTPGVHSRLALSWLALDLRDLLGGATYLLLGDLDPSCARACGCPRNDPVGISHRGDSGIRARSSTRDHRGHRADAEDDPPVGTRWPTSGAILNDHERDDVGRRRSRP